MPKWVQKKGDYDGTEYTCESTLKKKLGPLCSYQDPIINPSLSAQTFNEINGGYYCSEALINGAAGKLAALSARGRLATRRCRCKYNHWWVKKNYCQATCAKYDKAYDPSIVCCPTTSSPALPPSPKPPPSPTPPPPPVAPPPTPPPSLPSPPSPPPAPPTPPPSPPPPSPPPPSPSPPASSPPPSPPPPSPSPPASSRRLAKVEAGSPDMGRRLQSSSGCLDPLATSYLSSATTHDANACTYSISGCTTPTAANYVSGATVDDGSCQYTITGCLSPDSVNYDSTATQDDGTCIVAVSGCMDPAAANYIVSATSQPGGACEYVVPGCTIATGTLNYDSLATSLSGCIYAVEGCTDSLASNYLSSANIDTNDVCQYEVFGCMASSALNYDTLATADSGNECTYPSATNGYKGCTDSTYTDYQSYATISSTCVGQVIVTGCTDPVATNFDSVATTFDSSCVFSVLGCMDTSDANYDPTVDGSDPTACSGQIKGCTSADSVCYSSTATVDDGSCATEGCTGVLGCMDTTATTYTSFATKHQASSCVYPPVYGCTDPAASNYNAAAVGCPSDNAYCCTGYAAGCTDSRYTNYNDRSEVDDGSCFYQGCTLSYAFNYESFATTPTGNAALELCVMPVLGCTSTESANYNSNAQADDGTCQIEGCMDSRAPNYNPSATTPVAGVACPDGSVAGDDCGVVLNGGCDLIIEGCLIDGAVNYNAAANYDPLAASGGNTCILTGCMDSRAPNYKSWATSEYSPSDCEIAYIGCTDSVALNYWSGAQYDSYACLFSGCGDSEYFNYDPTVGVHEETQCVREILGCMDPTAWYNYGGPNVNVDDGSCIYAGCTQADRVYYNPLNTLQIYNNSYDDPLYAYCGGLRVPPPPPTPIDLSNAVSVQMQLLYPDCPSLFTELSVSTYDEAMPLLIAGSITAVDPFGVAPDGVYMLVRPCAAEAAAGRRLQLSDADTVAELQLSAPDGKTPQELVSELETVAVDEWSSALGVSIGLILICLYDADGTLRCNLPPPIPPPSAPPSPPPPSSGVPIVIIIVVVLLAVVLALAIAGGVYLKKRRQKRIEGSAVAPDVADRAIVQPPPLPPTAPPATATYNDRVPAQPPESTTQQ